MMNTRTRRQKPNRLQGKNSKEVALILQRVDWILFVEGKSDKKFYRKYVFESIQAIDEKKELEDLGIKVKKLKNAIDKVKKYDSAIKKASELENALISQEGEEIVKGKSGEFDSKVSELGEKFPFPIFAKFDDYATEFKFIKCAKEKLNESLNVKLNEASKEYDRLETSLNNELKKDLEEVLKQALNNVASGLNGLKIVLKKDPVKALQKAVELESLWKKVDEIREGEDNFWKETKKHGETPGEIIQWIIKAKDMEFQNSDEEKHFFGIVDKDYKTKKMNKCIMVTDANSLETMLIKHVGQNNIEKYLTDIFLGKIREERSEYMYNRCEECINEKKDVIMKIYEKSKEFALKIGRLRQRNEFDDFCKYISDGVEQGGYSYSDVIDYDSERDPYFVFKTEDYIDAIVNRMKATTDYKEKFIEKTMDDIKLELKNILEKPKEEPENAFDICHGHDFVNIIDQMFVKVFNFLSSESILKDVSAEKKVQDSQATSVFIDHFNDEWFSGPVYVWLTDIKNKAKNSKADKSIIYRNMILAVGGKNMKR